MSATVAGRAPITGGPAGAPAPGCVVVVHGRLDLVLECLAGLDGTVPVVLVDHGADGDLHELAARHGATVLGDGSNRGFAAGVNLGLAAFPGRDVLLLNPDAVISADGVAALQRALQDSGPRVAAVAPALRRPGGEVERSVWPVPSPSGVWCSVVGLHRAGPTFLNGAVLMLSADAVAELGGFDERFFLYCEEADWQLRAQQAGWQVAAVPDVTATHVGAASSDDHGARERFFHGSAELFVRKWYGAGGWWLFRLASLAAALRRCLFARSGPERRKHWRTARLYLAGPASRLPAVARERVAR